MKVAVYGGSFNPFGKNHEAVVAWLVERYDQVWVVPAVAHSDKPYLPSFHHRLRMAERGCKHFGRKVVVSTIEADMLSVYPNPILTYDVLCEIEARVRAASFGTIDFDCDHVDSGFIVECIHFAVGEDVLDSMDSWDRIDLTRSEFGVVVVPTQMTHATEVRALIANGDESWAELVPPTVAEYIHKTPTLYREAPLGLYLITPAWDVHSTAVVRAPNAEHARMMHPGVDDLCRPLTAADVQAVYLGPSLPGLQEPGVVCANYR